MSDYTLAELALKLKGDVHGDSSQVVNSLATLDKAGKGQLAFLSNPKYIDQLKITKASAVLISKEALSICPTNAIVIDNPYFAFAMIGQLFDRTPKYLPGIHPSAVINETAVIADSASIGPNVVIGKNTKVDENVVIEANSVVSDECVLGENTIIKSNVTIYHDVKFGRNCIVHAGAVIGGDGFGNAKDARGDWVKVPQLGGVTCGNNVEIGSNSTVDRGAINDTILEDGVKIDNLVQVAHNVEIGKNTALAAQTGIAGSSHIGKNCLFGGQVGISGHITIADGVMLGAQSGVTKSIESPGAHMSHMEAQPHMKWKRILSRVINIDKMHARIVKLEKKSQD